MKKTRIFLACLTPFFCGNLFSDDLSHRVHNCEIELEMMQNNIKSQEEGREKLYKEMEETVVSIKHVLKESEASASDPKQKLQKITQGLQSDFSTLKQHTNQLSSKLNELSTTVSSLKKEINAHSASLKNIEEAINLLTKALDPQKESSPVVSKNGKYKVQSGDSLDKISKKTGVSVKELKELNNLSSSVVRVGQELLLH
jgi:LysM repeat protein